LPENFLVTEWRKKELIRQFEAGGGQRRKAMLMIRGCVQRLSLEPYGCRVVQTALETSDAVDKEAIALELRGHVLETISSPHGNFVVQKVIELLPVASTMFVPLELASFAAEVARHRFGCRILCRLVEHHFCGENESLPATVALVDELLLEVDQLIHHNMARHVLDLILEHGNEVHKHEVSQAICSNIFYNAKSRNASYVIEKAMIYCALEDRNAIASELLNSPERFLMLATHECGSHVVKSLLRARISMSEQAKALLLTTVNKLKASKYGKKVLEEM
jgi:hypothetical protein